MSVTVWYFMPFVVLVILIITIIICYKGKSISDNILYNYGFWSFGLFSISQLVSIINAYLLPNISLEFIRQVSLLAGFIVLLLGFYSNFKAIQE